MAAAARKSHLFSTSVVREVHFGSCSSKVFSASAVQEVHFGSSSSKVATFQYKCSTGSAFWQLQLKSCNFSVQVQYRKCTLGAPARKSQLFSTSLVHFGRCSSKVVTFQYKCCTGSADLAAQLQQGRGGHDNGSVMQLPQRKHTCSVVQTWCNT